jgi:hypothetical protein
MLQVLVIVAQIPRSIALVVMERVLKNDRLELFWVWMWANIFELISVSAGCGLLAVGYQLWVISGRVLAGVLAVG